MQLDQETKASGHFLTFFVTLDISISLSHRAKTVSIPSTGRAYVHAFRRANGIYMREACELQLQSNDTITIIQRFPGTPKARLPDCRQHWLIVEA